MPSYAQEKKMIRNIFIKYSLVLLLILGLLQVGISVAYSNFGGTIQDLNNRSKEISLENQRFSMQVAKLESLANISSKAGELGFSKTEVIYLSPQLSAALLLESGNGKTN